MKYILFAAILFFPISTIGAYACICGFFRPPCEEYGSASAVFIGVVIGDSTIDSQDGQYQFQKRSVSFAVKETFHGLHGTSAEVITGMGGGDCGVGFKSTARNYAGDYSLRLELDLRGSHATLSKGEVFVDMQNYPPYGVPVPVDLTGREISIFVWPPAGSRGPASSPNGLQVFSKDVNFKSEYGGWENIQENTWMEVKLAPSIIAPSGGAMDPGFDPTRIRVIGLKIGTAEDSTDSYRGEFYIDSVSFTAPPAPKPTVLNERYGFEQSDEGFLFSGDHQFQAITSQARDTTQAANGVASNRLTIKLDGGESTRKVGEIYVDMLKSPPFRVNIPIDLDEKEVSAYVFCPPGARGDGGGRTRFNYSPKTIGGAVSTEAGHRSSKATG